MIENAAKPEQVSPPMLNNFIVINGPVQESGSEEYNGVLRTYVGISYILKPKRTGEFTIASATARADGKVFKSTPIKIKVVNSATGNSAVNTSPFGNFDLFEEPQRPTNYNDFIIKKGETVQDKINRNLFIKMITDKKSCYVGEPVVVTYKLYTRLKSESNISKNPALNGFSVIDLIQPQSGINYSVENFEGRDYNVYILRKAQLYPLQAGQAELEAASVDNNVHFVKEEYLRKTGDGYEFLPGVTSKDAMFDEKVTVESKPGFIDVKPLPAEGKPATFNGAVGSFLINAVIEKDSFTTDDAGKLRVQLYGEGNITLIPSPEVAWPKGLEGYEPVIKDGLNRLTVPVSGSKIFDFSFTAEKEGTYTIPSIEFSFFDDAVAKYKTISTKPVTVHIKKGTGKKPVMIAENKTARESFLDKLFTNRWMIIVPVALLIIIGLLVWTRADKKKQKEKLIAAALKQQEEEKAAADIIPANPLQQSESAFLQNNSRLFYAAIDKELHVFLARQLQLPAETISKKIIAEGLDKLNVGIADNLAVQKLLDDISLQLYTPYADDQKMQACYLEAVRLVNVIGNI